MKVSLLIVQQTQNFVDGVEKEYKKERNADYEWSDEVNRAESGWAAGEGYERNDNGAHSC